jgi:hypothetical protein
MADLIPDSLVPDRNGIALIVGQRQHAGLRGGNVTYSDIVDTDLLDSVASSRKPSP